MSARQVNSKNALGGKFTIRNAANRRAREWDRSLDAVWARLTPANFNDPKGLNRKKELGLHDLSASLLDGTREPMSVSTQLKPYDRRTDEVLPHHRRKVVRLTVARTASSRAWECAFHGGPFADRRTDQRLRDRPRSA
jgi:hypothetical protein